MNKKLALWALRNATGVVAYVFVVSQIMQNGERFFGKEDNILAPFAVLLLFSLSAAIVGGLTFGQTIILLLEGRKKDGIRTALYTVGWLAVYTLLGLLLLIVVK